MAPASLRDRCADGATALGAWISLRDPLLAEAAALAGFDYVVIDMQHGIADLADVVAMLPAMARTQAIPVVRVPWNEPGVIGRVLDAGALGVIIPLVNTVADAQRAVAACRYAPAGGRSIGPMVNRVRYGADYASVANEVVACVPMIETRQAVEDVDAILDVPGIDAVYMGPSDLSLTYGLSPVVDQHNDVFDDALQRVVDSCRRHGVIPGIHANAALAAKRHAAGFRMITVGFDASSAISALHADIAAARAVTARPQ